MNAPYFLHFEANGGVVNLDIGFIPAYVEVRNANASAGEVAKIVAFKDQLGVSEFQTDYVDASNGAAHAVESLESSTIYLDDYDSAVIGNRKSVTFDYTGGAVEALCTVSSGHNFVEGERVRHVESGGLAGNVEEGTTYYVKYISKTTYQLALTKGGTAVAMTSDGTAPNYVFSLDNLSLGQGKKGITIAADFMDDGDEIYVAAWRGNEKDEGDING